MFSVLRITLWWVYFLELLLMAAAEVQGLLNRTHVLLYDCTGVKTPETSTHVTIHWGTVRGSAGGIVGSLLIANKIGSLRMGQRVYPEFHIWIPVPILLINTDIHTLPDSLSSSNFVICFVYSDTEYFLHQTEKLRFRGVSPSLAALPWSGNVSASGSWLWPRGGFLRCVLGSQWPSGQGCVVTQCLRCS